MTKRVVLVVVAAASFAASTPVAAHSMHAAMLSLEVGPEKTTQIVLKIPRTEKGPRHLEVTFPPTCPIMQEPTRRATADAWIESWSVGCAMDALRGARITVQGLDPIVGELFVHVATPSWVTVIQRDSPSAILFGNGAPEEMATTPLLPAFFLLGVEHILSGLDHLMFVFALVLLIAQTRHDRLARTVFATITAFTVAHSLTLAGSVLGWFALPTAPVEIVIPLSVLLLAVELARAEPERTLTARYPWVVAFSFGLLHGFGFADALRRIGLPEGAVGSALLLFNLGVEAGQLAFVAVLALLWGAGRGLRSRVPEARRISVSTLERVAVYAIGTMSVYWCWQRIWMV